MTNNSSAKSLDAGVLGGYIGYGGRYLHRTCIAPLAMGRDRLVLFFSFKQSSLQSYLSRRCAQRGKEQAASVKKQLHDLVKADETRLATNKRVATEVSGLCSLYQRSMLAPDIEDCWGESTRGSLGSRRRIR